MKPVFRTPLVFTLLLLAACATEPAHRDAACERTVHQYAAAIDLGQPEHAASSFTDNAIWVLGETRLEGKEAIAAHFAALGSIKNRISRHVQTNQLIEWRDAQHGTGTVYVTLYRSQGGSAPVGSMTDQPFFVGHYQDSYVWDGQRCLIRERMIVPAFLSR